MRIEMNESGCEKYQNGLKRYRLHESSKQRVYEMSAHIASHVDPVHTGDTSTIAIGWSDIQDLERCLQFVIREESRGSGYGPDILDNLDENNGTITHAACHEGFA